MHSKTSAPASLPWVAITLLVLVSAQVARWVWLSLNESLALSELQAKFLSIYPSFLHNSVVVTWINFALAGLCLAWSIRLVARATKRKLYWLLLVWSSLLVLWLGFSVM